MIRFREGERYSDYTSEWYVYLDKTYTVGEFLDELLKMKPNDWGFITIPNMTEYFFYYFEGKLLDDKPASEMLSKTIQSVGCYGCFNSFDYYIRVKEDK